VCGRGGGDANGKGMGVRMGETGKTSVMFFQTMQQTKVGPRGWGKGGVHCVCGDGGVCGVWGGGQGVCHMLTKTW
jgi:hypothetical protein